MHLALWHPQRSPPVLIFRFVVDRNGRMSVAKLSTAPGLEGCQVHSSYATSQWRSPQVRWMDSEFRGRISRRQQEWKTLSARQSQVRWPGSRPRWTRLTRGGWPEAGEGFTLRCDLFGLAAQDDAIDRQAFGRFDDIAVLDVLRLFGGELQVAPESTSAQDSIYSWAINQ